MRSETRQNYIFTFRSPPLSPCQQTHSPHPAQPTSLGPQFELSSACSYFFLVSRLSSSQQGEAQRGSGPCSADTQTVLGSPSLLLHTLREAGAQRRTSRTPETLQSRLVSTCVCACVSLSVSCRQALLVLSQLPSLLHPHTHTLSTLSIALIYQRSFQKHLTNQQQTLSHWLPSQSFQPRT